MATPAQATPPVDPTGHCPTSRHAATCTAHPQQAVFSFNRAYTRTTPAPMHAYTPTAWSLCLGSPVRGPIVLPAACLLPAAHCRKIPKPSQTCAKGPTRSNIEACGGACINRRQKPIIRRGHVPSPFHSAARCMQTPARPRRLDHGPGPDGWRRGEWRGNNKETPSRGTRTTPTPPTPVSLRQCRRQHRTRTASPPNISRRINGHHMHVLLAETCRAGRRAGWTALPAARLWSCMALVPTQVVAASRLRILGAAPPSHDIDSFRTAAPPRRLNKGGRWWTVVLWTFASGLSMTRGHVQYIPNTLSQYTPEQ